ncbi:MAG: DHHA1 domain-containing protein [Halobacteriales archaeon]|nr:DHHA1 domain-containing protein [Halobacteriales archaeon]
MTASRAAAEPDVTSFEAAVAAVDGRDLVLEETYFYPEGGGQPADRGTVAGVPVADVQGRDGDVVHILEAHPDVEPGETVAAEVDPAFRTYCRRAHTASHVLYGAGRRLLDDLGYGGFGITPEKVRVDFETATTIDDGVLVDLERLVNRAVWDARPVSWEVRGADDALDDPEIAFNTKTEEGIAGDDVRVVTVEGWDVAACGGTHVANTVEIGPVALLDRSNPGEGLTRVEFTVGPDGIGHRAGEKRALLDAASALGTGAMDVPEEVGRLRDRVGELEGTVAELEEQLAGARLEELREEVVERDGRDWLVGAVDGLDANALGEHAQALAGDAADVVALVGRDGRTFVVVADAGDGDAAAVVEAVTDEFGGGGGGSPRFAQGGGIDAEPGAVVGALRN